MYKFFMPVYEGKKTETITAKVNIEQLEAFDDIAKQTDRPRSYIVRELALRGLAQFKRDGQLKLTADEEKIIAASETKKNPQAKPIASELPVMNGSAGKKK